MNGHRPTTMNKPKIRPVRAKSETETINFALSGRNDGGIFNTQGVALCWYIKGFQPFSKVSNTYGLKLWKSF